MHESPPWTRAPAELQDVATIFREHRAFVWRSLYHLGVERAMVDDALQDVFVVVHRKLATFDGERSMKRWLYGIARRVASDYRRGNRKGTRKLHVVPNPDTEAVSGDYGRVATQEIVNDLLQAVDDDKRQVFVLAELEGMTAPEIAQTLSLNVNTVYARLRAARQKFEAAAQRHMARQRRELA